MPILSSQGQITFPAKWKKFMGGIAVGDVLYFHIQNRDQIVCLSKEGSVFDDSAPLLRRSFITIPIRIREWFKLQPGDTLEFGYDDDRKSVFFRKKNDRYSCPICSGAGSIEEIPCFVCQEKSFIEKENWENEVARLMTISRKYGIQLSIINTYLDSTSNEVIHYPFPVIHLESRRYPKEILEKCQDYYQARTIKDTIEADNIEINGLKEYILSLLVTDFEKSTMSKWLIGRI